jgi:hypothetical protein
MESTRKASLDHGGIDRPMKEKQIAPALAHDGSPVWSFANREALRKVRLLDGREGCFRLIGIHVAAPKIAGGQPMKMLPEIFKEKLPPECADSS